MRRRTVLAGLASGLAAGLAGCTSQSSEPASTATTPPTTTASQSTATQSTTAAAPSSDAVYTLGDPVIVNDNNLSVQLSYYVHRSSVPHYSRETETVLPLRPPDDKFLSVSFNFYNRSGETIQRPSYQPFSVWIAGDTHSQLQGLPDDTEWTQLRQGNLDHQLSQPWWVDASDWDKIQADRTAYPSFLFSIPDVDMSRVYIQWRPDFRDEPLYFRPITDN